MIFLIWFGLMVYKANMGGIIGAGEIILMELGNWPVPYTFVFSVLESVGNWADQGYIYLGIYWSWTVVDTAICDEHDFLPFNLGILL